MGAELLRAERQTYGRWDIKLIVAFRNFANAPRNYYTISSVVNLSTIQLSASQPGRFNASTHQKQSLGRAQDTS